MKNIVYIDVLFFINFIINLLIFLSVSVIIQRREVFWKYIAASSLGALYSCIVFTVQISPMIIYLIAILLYFLIIRFIFGYKNYKLCIKTCVVTVLCTAFFGGLIMMLYLFTGIGSVMTFNNGAMYIDIPVFVLLIFCAVAYGILWLVSFILSSRGLYKGICDVVVKINGKNISLSGFVDTGNKITDPITNLPVIIAKEEVLKDVLPFGVLDYLKFGNTENIIDKWKVKTKALPCNTVIGQKLIYAVKCDSVYVNSVHRGECLISLIKDFDEGNYNAIIPISIMNK